jgi:small subunit ribosomal protein S20
MPHSVSSKKRHRQNLKRRAHNRSVRSMLKTLLRKVRAAAAAGDVETAEKDFRLAAKKLDQAGARKIIHANTASRLKSRLSARIKAAKTAKA